MIEQLAELAGTPGAKISFTLQTSPPLNKTHRETGQPCPYEAVYRTAERTVILGCRYGSCVNRQRVREHLVPDFEPKMLWNGKGEYLPDHPCVVRHVDNPQKLYVAFLPLRTVHDEWHDENGNPVDPAVLKFFFKPYHKNKRQGTQKEVLWRTVALENILDVRHEES